MAALTDEEALGVAITLHTYFDSDDEKDIDERPRKRRASFPYVLQRKQFGAFHLLVQELKEQDPKALHQFLRMSGDTFDDLLHIVGPDLQKQDTNFKEAISPEERLAVTLRFLAQGGPFTDLKFLFWIPASTLAYLIPETCTAIYKALKQDYLTTPSTQAAWASIQNVFLQRWNFPQCIGAMDGKHVRIKCPQNGGSGYFNYLHYHSIVLFAIADAEYKFIYHEVGAQGRVGDATIWNQSNFKVCLERGLWNTPPPLAAPRSNVCIPSCLVADSAFALSPLLMKPYPDRDLTRERRTFNYRLSRARRVVENAFGILASRFGMFQGTIVQGPESVKKFVLASLALHNFLREKKDQQYCGYGYVDHEQSNHVHIPGQWRQVPNVNLDSLQYVAGGGHQNHASGTIIRDALKEYFMNEGAVSWQEARVD